MTDYIWVLKDDVQFLHDMLLNNYCGLDGVRDENLLHSALARPENLLVYGNPDIADLAAAYGYGLAKNHPFNDANKRTAYGVTELFLMMNGYEIQAPLDICYQTMIAMASDKITEAEFATWLRTNIVTLNPDITHPAYPSASLPPKVM